MVQSDIELQFSPEVNPLCYLLDAPILLPVIIISYILVQTEFMQNIMLAVMFGSIGLWIIRFYIHNTKCSETEVRVFPDRIEIEVGMKNPKLTMIEYVNLKEITITQTTIQRMFNSHSIVFIFKSDFDENKDLKYVLRDFKDPNPICSTIRRTAEHAGLIKKMT